MVGVRNVYAAHTVRVRYDRVAPRLRWPVFVLVTCSYQGLWSCYVYYKIANKRISVQCYPCSVNWTNVGLGVNETRQ